MIKVVVYDKPKRGLYPYRIDGHWGPGGAPLIGITHDPLLEAARVLEALGVHPLTEIELVGKIGHMRTTIEGVLQLPLPLPPLKALPAPKRRAARKRFQVSGSGIPGDG